MGKTYGMIISAMLLWGSIGIFVRAVPLTSQELVLARCVLGGLFLMGAFFLRKQKPDMVALKKYLPLLTLSGVVMGINWIFLFKAFTLTTVSAAILAYYCAPIFVLIASTVLLKEPLTWVKVVAVISAMAGMVLVNGTDMGGANPALGLIFGLAAAVFYACVTVINKFVHGLTGLETTIVQLLAATPVALVATLVTHEGPWLLPGGKGLLALLVLGIVHTGVCLYLYFSAVQKLPGQTVAILSYIDPGSALFFAAIFLNERLTWLQFLGAILILGGAAFGEMYRRNRGGRLP
jgi:RarD protein